MERCAAFERIGDPTVEAGRSTVHGTANERIEFADFYRDLRFLPAPSERTIGSTLREIMSNARRRSR